MTSDGSFRVRVWLFACLGAMALACSSKPDFGTLPRVEVPIERPPPKAEPPKKKEPEPEPQVTHDPADPKAVRSRRHVELTIGFSGGEMSLLGHREVESKLPQPSARRVGRFAAELWVGRTLLERVRFDFPLLAAPDEGVLEPGLSTKATVKLPSVERATRLRILDRKTRDAIVVPWPLEGSSSRVRSGGMAGAPGVE